MRTDYTPFIKDIFEISTDDLAVLRTVAEGWYVEYKREVPNAGAVAKSITAFANTYGGWLFYGIDEKSKDDPVAGDFAGIGREAADGELQRIRQAVANHAQPSPYFLVKALYGPADALGLPEDRCIIMAYVPWGPDAPFIHKDGRIYRRVGDGSEPKPENDRFILDQLWQRSAKILDRYAEWTDTELETSKGEKDGAYVRIFVIPDFWRDHPPGNHLSIHKIREIMAVPELNYNVPFDNIYESAGSYVCRQTQNNAPQNLGLTWKIRSNLMNEIIVPLSKFKATELVELAGWLSGYETASQFLELCRKQGYSGPTVLDLNILTQVLLALSQKQARLLDAYGWTGDLSVKLHISGVWHSIPFIDAGFVMDEYTQHGISLCLQDAIKIHPGKHETSFIIIPRKESGEDDSGLNRYVMMAIRLFIAIARALGVPLGVRPDGDGSEFADSVGDLLQAGDRARQVQARRSRSP